MSSAYINVNSISALPLPPPETPLATPLEATVEPPSLRDWVAANSPTNRCGRATYSEPWAVARGVNTLLFAPAHLPPRPPPAPPAATYRPQDRALT